MNGYDAQDMATQGAEGFRNGYQAGYADAVKAVEVGKPAAAQEAVVWGIRIGASDSWGYTHNEEQADFIGKQSGLPYEKKPLYAAPVAAAPLDGGQVTGWRNVNGIAVFTVASHSGITPDQEFVRYDDHLAALASTPAAPGIDHVSDILTDLSCVADSWVVEAAGAAADARNHCAMQIMEAIERWSNRLNLGDTSPKGGSDSSDAPWRPISELPISDDLFWFARGDTIDGPRVPQAGGYDADEWNWFAPAEAPGFTPEMDAERDQQHREMQATSAEVGS